MRTKDSAFRYSVIRSMVSLAGDLGAGIAVAATCSWVIETATLGLFLSFLIWLLGLIVSLALSQHVVHPTVRFVLADDKFDRGLNTASALFDHLNTPAAQAVMSKLWRWPMSFKSA